MLLMRPVYCAFRVTASLELLPHHSSLAKQVKTINLQISSDNRKIEMNMNGLKHEIKNMCNVWM